MVAVVITHECFPYKMNKGTSFIWTFYCFFYLQDIFFIINLDQALCEFGSQITCIVHLFMSLTLLLTILEDKG